MELNLNMKKSTRRGIRQRWMVNSLGIVFLIVTFAVAAFSTAMGGYYYSAMTSGLRARAENVVEFLSNYSTQREYYQRAVSYINSSDKSLDGVDIQFLDANGAIRFSSFGLTAYSAPGTPDIEGALDREDPKTTSWTGNNPSTGEHVMAVSVPLVRNGRPVAVVRYMTSLRLVDRQLMGIIALSALVGLGILAIVYFSGLYFVKSIVEPVTQVTEITRRIAGGSYGVQIEKRNDDEIGDLTDAINDMSSRIDQAEKMKNEFISSVSHELRTPLTAINGWAETIQQGEVRDAGDVKKGMEIIVSEARRLTSMVEELLEFSRLQDGRFTLSIEPVDLKAEFEDAVYTYKEFFRKDGIELHYVDDGEEFPLMDADPSRLRQVFCNILDNAAKHGGAGKRIDASIGREGEWAVIKVRDYGPGIPGDELPHVKTKFYKGSSKARGSGIGLAVCDEIVTRHGGELLIDNAVDGGCVVTIRLPEKADQENGT